MLARRLLQSTVGTLAFRLGWGVDRYVSNPIITVNPGNPAENVEQYTPAPIGPLPDGSYWVYVKGASRIYAWKSTDGGFTFSLQNGGAAVLAPTSGWELSFVLEPTAVYDVASGTIHLYYKGDDSNPANWQWGHATAADSAPTVFTRDPANPILTKANAQSDLGGVTTSDLAISDVIKVGSTFHFYGYALYGGLYHLIQATGTTWNDPSSVNEILASESTSFEVTNPCVVRMASGSYVMLYTRGGASTAPPRGLRVGTSLDGVSWNFATTDYIMSGTTGWEDGGVYAASVLKAQAAPYSDPVLDGSGRWYLYFSGISSTTHHANTGLAFLAPPG